MREAESLALKSQRGALAKKRDLCSLMRDWYKQRHAADWHAVIAVGIPPIAIMREIRISAHPAPPL